MRRILLALFEGILNVFLVFALVLGGGWYVFVHLPEERRRVDDPAYAPTLFADLVPVTAILESRRWHPPGGEAWDCTYAIAELDPAAPSKPPVQSNKDAGWQFAFGGDWLPTPGPPLGDTVRDALDACAKYWTAETRTRVVGAASTPGGWIARDPVGETVFLYSRPERIVARIRFGD